MHHNQWKLLTNRRFLPLFVTQFLGAFNDNVFKNALVILITYTAMGKAGFSPQIMVTLAAGIFILPFFLFSAIAGQLADKLDKARVIRYVKFVEIALMMLAAIGFYLDNLLFLLVILFLMGAQSAFFGPLKYSILPDQLHENELIGGNALVGAGTFIAILLGTIVGGLLILAEQGGIIISTTVIITALAGWLFSLFIPSVSAAAPDTVINRHIMQETAAIVHHTRQNATVFHAVLGISWFWLFGATFLSQFPTFAKEVISGNEQIVTLFLTLFSVGIGIGALLCNKLLKGAVAATYVPLGVLGMTLFTIDLYFASTGVVTIHSVTSTELIGAGVFLESFAHWRILLDLLAISICGGLYIVPLYAIVQNYAEPSHRSRAIATNNIMNALFMVVSALGISFMLALDFTVPEVFLTIAILNGLVAIYVAALLPYELARSILQWLFHTLFRLEIKGLEHYQQAGDKVLITANHLSFLDAILLSVCFPERLCFAINTNIARKWWVRPFLFLADTIPADPTNPLSMRQLIERIRNGDKVVIFPEGRLTLTGSLMKIYEGSALVADKSGAKLLPVSLSGPQYTPFSRLKGKVKLHWLPKITATISPPETFELTATLRGRKRRRMAALKLYDIMTNAVFQSHVLQHTLFQSLLDAKTIHGRKHIIAEDIERKPLTYQQLITRSFVLGLLLRKYVQPQKNIGVMLPNTVASLISFFALQAFGRIPAMLNFSTSSTNLVSACHVAQIQAIVTSRKFIETAQLNPLVTALEAQSIKLIYLEELQHQLHWWHKLIGLLAGFLPQIGYRLSHAKRKPDTPAVILFTSGSEDTPKGVALSHINLQANRFQTASRIDFGPTDIVFNALPIFHSFGLTGGTLLPVLSGIRTFLYPSPLHYRIIPELAYDTNATLLFGTDTFLAGYARLANAYDFYSIRYVFAGAEALRDSTRRLWSENFGVRIFEGYGTTETSPILSLNTPMHNHPGSVGRLLPGIHYKLEPVPGIERGGKLLVSGPNIMLGYYLSANAGMIVPPAEGWHDTGDIVEINDEGFIFIKGRAKRFAKIGGEMVSLAAVEDTISRLWPGHHHAAVRLPDPKKGEQIVLITTHAKADRNELIAYFRKNGQSELGIPRNILYLETLPMLGNGKTDYVTLNEWVQQQPLQSQMMQEQSTNNEHPDIT